MDKQTWLEARNHTPEMLLLAKQILEEVRREIAKNRLTDEQIGEIRDLCRQVRESTNRAVFFNDGHLQAWLGIGAFNGIGIFPMLCLTEPDYVAELHELVTEYTLSNARLLLPESYRGIYAEHSRTAELIGQMSQS